MKNVLVITYWSYKDALIQTYTLPYVKMIQKNLPENSRIWLVTNEQPHLKLKEDEKINTFRQLESENIKWVPLLFSKFGLLAITEKIFDLFKLLFICYIKKITVIHAWCTPAGVTGYILSILTGKPLIIDGYEPHAEPSVENGEWKKNSFAFKFLFFFEKLMAKRVHSAIATSTVFKDYAFEKYKVDFKTVFIKPPLVDLERFSPLEFKDAELLKKLDLENKIVCVYAGKTGGIYLEKEIFDFYKACYDFWGDRFRALMLTDTPKKNIERLCAASRLKPETVVAYFLRHKFIPSYMGLADFAINPVKPVPSKRCCTSIKDGEYWAMGLPVIITDSLTDDCRIIKENGIGVVLESIDEKSYLKAISEIDLMLKNNSRQQIQKKIRPIAEKYRSFSIGEDIYKIIYAS